MKTLILFRSLLIVSLVTLSVILTDALPPILTFSVEVVALFAVTFAVVIFTVYSILALIAATVQQFVKESLKAHRKDIAITIGEELKNVISRQNTTVDLINNAVEGLVQTNEYIKDVSKRNQEICLASRDLTKTVLATYTDTSAKLELIKDFLAAQYSSKSKTTRQRVKEEVKLEPIKAVNREEKVAYGDENHTTKASDDTSVENK